MNLKAQLLAVIESIMLGGGQITQDDYAKIKKILAAVDFHELGAGLPDDRNPHPLPSGWAHHVEVAE